MKKFNLFNEIIITDKQSLLNALNSHKEFGINPSGEIVYAPFKTNEMFIYKGTYTSPPTSALMPAQALKVQTVLGKNYQVVVDEDRLLIKAGPNWQEIIGFNTIGASYDDTTGDGVAAFAEKEHEDLGWHATEFDIDYRDIVEYLEENCDGTILCIEQEEPFMFSGFGFFADNKQAKQQMFDYCKNKINELLDEADEFERDDLDATQEAAAKYFDCL